MAEGVCRTSGSAAVASRRHGRRNWGWERRVDLIGCRAYWTFRKGLQHRAGFGETRSFETAIGAAAKHYSGQSLGLGHQPFRSMLRLHLHALGLSPLHKAK